MADEEGFLLAGDTCRDLAKGLRRVQRLSVNIPTGGDNWSPLPDDRRWLGCQNLGSAAIPYGCLQVYPTGVTDASRIVSGSAPSEPLLLVNQFGAGGAPPGQPIFAFAGGETINAGANGQCTQDWPAEAAYDSSGTPTLGDTWIPKSGQWTLTKSTAGAANGFLCLGIANTQANTMLVAPAAMVGALAIGKANYAIATGAQNYVELYTGTPGSETDTGNQVQAWNWFAPVTVGQWVILAQINGNWYIVGSGGSTVAVVQVTTSNTAVAGGSASVGQPVSANAQGLFDAQVQTLTGGTTSFQGTSPWTGATSVWLALSNQPGGSTDADTLPTAIAGDSYVAFQLGSIDPGSGSRPLYVARQAWRGPLLAQAKFDTPSGTQKNFEVYAGVAGSETDQGYTVAAWNYGAPIFDGGWAFLDWNGYSWYVVGWGADTVVAQINGPAGGSLSTPAGQLVQPAGGCFDASVLYFAPGATNLTTSSPVSADDDIWLAIIDHPGNVSAGVFSSDAQTVGDWFVATSFGTMNPGGSAGSRPLYVARRGSQPILAQPAAAIAQGASGSCNIYSGTPGSETSLGATVTAFSPFGGVPAGQWVWLHNNGSGWYIVATAGQPTLAKASYPVAQGSSNSFAIYSGTPGSETATGANVTAYALFDNIPYGSWVWLNNNGSGWYAVRCSTPSYCNVGIAANVNSSTTPVTASLTMPGVSYGFTLGGGGTTVTPTVSGLYLALFTYWVNAPYPYLAETLLSSVTDVSVSQFTLTLVAGATVPMTINGGVPAFFTGGNRYPPLSNGGASSVISLTGGTAYSVKSTWLGGDNQTLDINGQLTLIKIG